jgi:hypothetical protein
VTLTDEAKKARDRRLRRAILMALHRSRQSPQGGLSAIVCWDIVETDYAADDQKIEDEAHAMALLIDLRDGGYVELLDRRTHKRQRYGVEILFARITAKGSALVREEIPVDAMVEDERL